MPVRDGEIPGASTSFRVLLGGFHSVPLARPPSVNARVVWQILARDQSKARRSRNQLRMRDMPRLNRVLA